MVGRLAGGHRYQLETGGGKQPLHRGGGIETNMICFCKHRVIPGKELVGTGGGIRCDQKKQPVW